MLIVFEAPCKLLKIPRCTAVLPASSHSGCRLIQQVMMVENHAYKA